MRQSGHSVTSMSQQHRSSSTKLRHEPVIFCRLGGADRTGTRLFFLVISVPGQSSSSYVQNVSRSWNFKTLLYKKPTHKLGLKLFFTELNHALRCVKLLLITAVHVLDH